MEKYRKFADPKTGINPFIPVYSNKKSSFSDLLLHAVNTDFLN